MYFVMENQTVLSQRTALLFTCLLYSSCRPQIGSPCLSPHPLVRTWNTK